jgi:DNA polymerase-3 subunit beta
VTEGVFPFIELPPSDGPMIAVEQDKMERMLRFAAFAVSREEKHANLRGALFEVADGEASLVATDGHRLARYSVKTKAAPTRMLLPEALLGAMSKTVDKDAGGSCSLVATDGSVFACLEDSAGDVCLSHRPVAGPFPNYRAILPSKAEASVRVAAASVALAVRRCMSFADASQLVSMTVMPAELRLSAAEVSTGETVDKLPVSSAFQFPALTLHFRGGYLLEALTRIDGDVTLSFARVGANMGLWITHMPVEDERFEYVLMSLHLKA